MRQIPSARHIVRIEEYIHQPQIDASRPNAYAMIIGLAPGAPLRAIGEVDYENARIVAGRGLEQADAAHEVAVVGRLYARERLGFDAQVAQPLPDASKVRVGGRELPVVGIYATGNDFGDNHVFVPIETFRAIFKPGDRPIYELLQAIARERTVVVVTHSEELARLAHCILHLRDGRLRSGAAAQAEATPDPPSGQSPAT
jgi:hypothetical protein